jgi:hypothetical protein
MEEKLALKARTIGRHALGLAASHSLSKSMILYWIMGIILDGLESLEISKSMA